MLAGLLIDTIDLMTLGPIGLYAGLLSGGLLGYWLAPELGFARNARWVAALLAGVYCTLPLTGFLPAATLSAGVARLWLGDDSPLAQREGSSGSSPSPDSARSRDQDAKLAEAVDVEFRSTWDESEDSDNPPS